MEWKFSQIVGHEKEKAELQTMLREGRLPHALLFSGPDGIGKRMVAHALAAAILCGRAQPCGTCENCRAMQSGTHPDFYELQPEIRGKSTRIIRIEAIRELQTIASRYPVLARQRVIIIDDADAMNEAAANSLLKTLEEPEGPVTFILVTSARSALLDTIISRCMPMAFGTLSQTETTEVLRQHDVLGPEAEKLAALADGSPGRALHLQANGGLELRDDAWQFLTKLRKFSLNDIWQTSQQMGDWSREKLGEWFLHLNMFLRDLLILQEDGGSQLLYHPDYREEMLNLLPALTNREIFAMLRLVRDLQKRLQSNVNLRLQMEGFFLRMRDIIAS